MTIARRRIAWSEPAFFFATWGLLLVAGRTRMFRDPGTFWHVLTGERILEHGLPRVDWLTFTYGGKPWIAHQWLAEVAMAGLHRVGGFDALLLATTGVLALLFTWLLARVLCGGVHARWAVLLCAVAVMTSASHLHVRPHIVSIVFFAWIYARLVDVDHGRAPLASLFWCVPVLVIWVNSHGAVLGGLASIGLTVMLWAGFGLLRKPSPIHDRPSAFTALLILVACWSTVLVNPYGLDMPRTWWAIVRSQAIAQLIVEHASVARTQSWHVLPLGLILGTAVATAQVRWRVTSFVALVWFALMCQRVRHAPLFAVAALLVLGAVLPTSSLATWLGRWRLQLAGASPRTRFPVRWLLPIPLVAILGGAALPAASPVYESRLVHLDRAWWPVDLIPAITRAQAELGPGAPILNDTIFGGFIEYYAPGLSVFSDDRCELFGDDFMRREMRGDADWLTQWTDAYGVRIALARRGSPIDAYLQRARGWQLAASSSSAVLYRRAG